MVWYGMVWYGMVLVLYCMVSYDTVWYNIVLYYIVWCDVWWTLACAMLVFYCGLIIFHTVVFGLFGTSVLWCGVGYMSWTEWNNKR